MKNRTIIIGIDGATFDVINPMVERGELPTFKRLMDQGAWGRLRSTYPPHTVPAWVSCYTGVNPGKLGLYDFCRDLHCYGGGALANALDVKTKPLWSVLGERGKKVLVVCVPFTYPPIEVNGVMVSPVRIIETDKISTFPAEIAAELRSNIDLSPVLQARRRYMELHKSLKGSDLFEFMEVMADSSRIIVEKLTECIVWLMGKYDYDFAMFMLPIDSIQHHLWSTIDENHPARNMELNRRFKNTIYDGYKQIDDSINTIMGVAGDGVSTMVVSDHGFGPLYKEFYLNRWLISKGLLKLKKGDRSGFARGAVSVSRICKKLNLGFVERLLPGGLGDVEVPVVKRRVLSDDELIDWQNTRAYATSYALNINLKDREPQGVVENGADYEELVRYLKGELLKIEDEKSGERIIDGVLEKHEVYNGPYVDGAVDLIINFKDPKYSIRKDVLYPGLFRKLNSDDRMTGHHTSFPDGVCVINGPKVTKKSELKGLQITDVAPTALYLMGEGKPEWMDGRVIEEAVDGEYLKGDPVVVVEGDGGNEGGGSGGGDLTVDEEESIKERLRELGYMG